MNTQDKIQNYLIKKQEAEEQELRKLKSLLPHINTDIHNGGVPMYKWQWDFFLSRNRMCLLTAANQIGKMVRCVDKIPTPLGYKKVEDICVGDYLFGSDGKKCRVIDIPYEGTRPCYKITFDDGSNVTVSQEHLWKCKTEKNRFRPEYTCNRGSKKGQKIPNPDYGKWQVLETQEIIKAGGYDKPGKIRVGKKVAIPVCEPVEYPEKDLKVDPYIMGAMIGDGDCKNMVFGCGDPEMTKRVVTGNIRWEKSKKNYSYGKVHLEDEFSFYKIRSKSSKKFIPTDFLLGSVEQRLELLRGLMDTDGSIYGKNTLEYCTVSEKLKNDFIELVNSLGGILNKVTIKNAWYYDEDRNRIPCKDAYSIRFKIQVNPFWIERKASKWRKNIRYKHQRIIEKIEPTKEEKGRCFTVDNEDSTFLVGKEYIVTHNSSIQIRKLIHWATEPRLWGDLWPESNHNVAQFWYLYPTQDVATIEFDKKWIPEWMPREEMRNDPQYGWKPDYVNRKIKSVTFNTGVTIYFKSYSQSASDLQTGTCHYIATDEELPVHLYDELKFRTSATSGHFSMAFTATLGQYEWECAMEKQGTSDEVFPKAKKIQVSLYDCLQYTDKEGAVLLDHEGKPVKTPWNEAKIQDRVDSCSSKEEVQKRIYGRFVQTGGLKYARHLSEGNEYKNWVFDRNYHLYSAVDPGSGGKNGHPSAIVFLAVSPDYTEGVLFLGWRGDGIPTTSGDTLAKYIELKGKLTVANQWYDYRDADFPKLAAQIGEQFEKAEKKHEVGEPILKTLLKYNALKIVTGNCIGLEEFMTETQEDELVKLIAEFKNLRDDMDKRHAKDDLIDATRYVCAKIPWNMEKILKNVLKIKKPVEVKHIPKTDADRIKERRGIFDQQVEDDFMAEIDFWNEHY